ncbi:hypothetical protein SAMN05216378_4749 [Paenibacillus catalpae]|uniref:Uncharacterized protein n=1 Tax=Paenibacillus catalpae TaxID=1045775 RepID=A0A1I2FAY8_9BACL|nr:hypothetical protein SAMN05216378_4749 [Paenibacillus catalpae]
MAKVRLLDFYHFAFEQTFYMINDKLKKKLFLSYCKWFNLEENM